jgi:UDP-glucose 4-epimerase
MRILVTGGAGFIGASVVRALLDRGDDAVVLDSGVACGLASIDQTRATILNADLRDRDALARALDGCAAVVHLAAQASVPASIARPLDDFDINVDGSLALLEAARARDILRIVFASSNAVIGGHPPPAHEGLVPFPVSPYGAAKAATEAYLRAYHHAFGMETVALRFANAYGTWSAHKTSVIAAFVKAYLRGGPLVINGTGRQTRDFVHVDDVAAMVIACLDAPADLVAGEIFQVGSGTETSLNQLAKLLFRVGGRAVPIEHGPASPGDVPRNYSDIMKARQVLGFAAKVGLRDGLLRTLDWFRDLGRD